MLIQFVISSIPYVEYLYVICIGIWRRIISFEIHLEMLSFRSSFCFILSNLNVEWNYSDYELMIFIKTNKQLRAFRDINKPEGRIFSLLPSGAMQGIRLQLRVRLLTYIRRNNGSSFLYSTTWQLSSGCIYCHLIYSNFWKMEINLLHKSRYSISFVHIHI